MNIYTKNALIDAMRAICKATRNPATVARIATVAEMLLEESSIASVGVQERLIDRLRVLIDQAASDAGI